MAGGEGVASFFTAPIIAKGLGIALGKVNSLGALAKSQVNCWWDKDLSLLQGSKKLDVYPTVTSAKYGQSVLDGINPRVLNSDRRFGKVLYLAKSRVCHQREVNAL